MCSCTTHGADCGFSVRCAVCGVEELLYLDISHKIKADLLLWNTSTFTLLSEEPGGIAKFRAEPWVFQQTLKTPLKELNRFVSIFLSPFSFDEGVLSTDEVVFEPKSTLHLFANNSLSVEDQYHLVIRRWGSKRQSLLTPTWP